MALKKRSEKASAADRTIPMFADKESKKVDVKNITVSCDACEFEGVVAKLEQRPDGDFECPECGAPIEVGKETKKALKESTTSSKPVEKEKVESKSKKEKGESSATTGVFCSECGTQWAKLHGKAYAICGHKADGVDDPSNAKRIFPPGGAQWPTVKKVRVIYGEQMFRIADYSTFRTPVIELEAEIQSGQDWKEVKNQLFLQAKKAADESFEEIFASYMEKLGLIRKATADEE